LRENQPRSMRSWLYRMLKKIDIVQFFPNIRTLPKRQVHIFNVSIRMVHSLERKQLKGVRGVDYNNRKTPAHPTFTLLQAGCTMCTPGSEYTFTSFRNSMLNVHKMCLFFSFFHLE
jgi:hypothetical protein